jgi:putative transposase
MPRQPRLDAVDLLQHVMARGIERREIFRDDKDRKSFLDRLAVILEETQTQCYAWALIPNHVHVLLRTGTTPLSKVMRRLMTGYAVTFNKRYKRSGHLFQNRYKSVVCEEDPYMLELIRYIHLNPLRAGVVRDLKELDKYPWTGHSAILGRRNNPLTPNQLDKPDKLNRTTKPNSSGKFLAEKTMEDVLLHFGDTKRAARRRYREFVEKGIDQGTRPELQGGGLVRSVGGDKRGLLGRKKEEREKGDERILGSGDFVNEILRQSERTLERRYLPKRPIEELVEIVAGKLGLKPELICSGSRQRKYSEARALVAYLAVEETGHSAAHVARSLGVKRVSIHQAVPRGKTMLANLAFTQERPIN